jgi:hypothetical protein
LQIAIRYSAKLEWLAQAFPILDPSRYGWTLELCLALWVWIVFWGAAFVVRERDHVTFDVIYGARQSQGAQAGSPSSPAVPPSVAAFSGRSNRPGRSSSFYG